MTITLVGTPEARAILWVAGGATQLRFPDAVNVARFIDLVREHKLSSTAAARMQDDESIPQAIRTAVEVMDRDSAEHAGRIERDVQRLATDLVEREWPHGPVLYLKGHSAHIHTGATLRGHRPTTDIDLLASAPEALRTELGAMGYRPGKPGISHELSSLHAQDRVDIDLHRYFPAWSYPEGVVQDTNPSTTRVRTDRLTYETLLHSSVAHPAAASSLIRVPGPEATALIAALHAFKDYVEASFTHGERKVTLLEVLEFDELSRIPGFDDHLFDELTESVGGQDAVDFVRSLLSDLSGSPDTSARRRFPREMGRGFLRAADEPLLALIQMQSFYAGLIEQRPVTDWPRLTAGPVTTSVIDSAQESRALPALVCSPHSASAPPRHEIAAGAADGSLTVNIRSGIPREDLHYFVHVVLGFADRYEKVSLDLVNDTVLRTNNGVATSMTITADSNGWRASFDVPVDALRHDEPAVLHSYQFLRPLDDDWNHLYDDSLVSTAIPVRLSEAALSAS